MPEYNVRTIARDELEEALQEHEKWFRSRGEDGNRAEFAFRNFSSISQLGPFVKKTLAGISFRGSLFDGNRFIDCNCVATSFQDCWFENVRFENCDFRASNCRSARFANANFNFVDFGWSDFEDARFDDSELVTVHRVRSGCSL